MKKILLLFLLVNFSSSFGQSMMTVRDVYDFAVNDEFQSRRFGNVPPNATRIKITGKYFSANNDTVFSIRHFNNYVGFMDTTGGNHLGYHVSIGTDTISYRDLDSL